MQKLVVVSHTLCTHVGGPKQFGGRWDPAPKDCGLVDSLETYCSRTCVILPSFVALGHDKVKL